MTRSHSTKRVLRGLALSFWVFVMLGMVDGALGVAWPSISTAFGRGISDLGYLLVAAGIGYLTASTFYGALHDRLGTGVLLGIGAAVLTVGLAGMTFAPVWPLVVVSPLVIGLGGGLVDTGMNAHAALAFDNRSMNLLHACFGVGATLGPLVLTVSLMSTGDWRAGYGFLLIAQGATGVAIWLRRRRWEAEEAGSGPNEGDVGRRRRRSVMLIVLFLLYTGVEFGAGQWAFTLLTEGRGLGTANAGVWVAAFWGGLTVGRLGVGLVGARWKLATILHVAIVIVLGGLAILWLDPGGMGALGLPITGLGLAPIFPTLVSLTPQRIGRDRSTHSIGYQLAAATIGASLIPWVIGLVAAANGLQTIAISLFAIAVLLAAAILISEREARVGS